MVLSLHNNLKSGGSEVTACNVRLIHKGSFLSYYIVDYELPNGSMKHYEVISRNKNLNLDNLGEVTEAVCAIILDKSHTHILLPKEFRLSINDYIYGTTAGLVDPGETPREAIIREIREETGLVDVNIIAELPAAYTCVGVTDECIPTFICEASGDPKDSTDIVENIHSEWFTKEEARDILDKNDIKLSGRLQMFIFMWVNGGIR